MLRGGRSETGGYPPCVAVSPGQVLSLHFAVATSEEAGPASSDESAEHSGDGDRPSDDAAAGHGDSSSDTSSPSGGSATSDDDGASEGPGSMERSRSPRGTTSLLAHGTSADKRHLHTCSQLRVEMWRWVLMRVVLCSGPPSLTSFLLLLAVCGQLAAGFSSALIFPCAWAFAAQRHGIVLPLLLVAICITPTAAGAPSACRPEAEISFSRSLPRPDVPFQAVEAAAGQCVMRPGSIETGRRVATPCRGRHVRPIAHLPPLQDPADSTRGPIRSPTGPMAPEAVVDGTLQHIAEHTLLREASQREDFSGYAAAAAMLEVLYAAFPTPGPLSPATLRLCTSVPVRGSGLFGFGPFDCSHWSTDPSDAQELTIGDTPLGFSFADCMPKISLRAAGWPRVDRDTATVCQPARSLECRFGAFFGGSHCRAR